MQITFQNAKNNEKTALIDGLYLHSNYNPSKESERFVTSLDFKFTPSIIIITEPCISYAAQYLHEAYPDTKIGCIRYVSDFNEYNNSFDFVINYFDFNNSLDFENYLFNILGEEKLLNVQFIQWPNSSRILSEIDKSVWNSIKEVLNKSKTLLITRQYFEKKWLINSVNFIKYTKEVCQFARQIDIPVAVIASGPSLKENLATLKEHQNKLFIIALSSSISTCIQNEIIPDLCLSTDGGYWAGQHLKKLYKYDIPLALSLESFCSKKLLTKNTILPLNYSDGISNKVLNASKISFSKAERNGTVSGTALQLAMNITTEDILFLGLDLANQKGFQHTQPNELEYNNSFLYCKTANSDTKAVRSEFSTGSLEIYQQWFQGFNTINRNIFRVINPDLKKNNLGKIKDINTAEFMKLLNKYTAVKNKDYFKFSKNHPDIKSIIEIFSGDNSYKLKKQLFPLDFVLYSHEKNPDVLSKIDKNYDNIIKKIMDILNG